MKTEIYVNAERGVALLGIILATSTSVGKCVMNNILSYSSVLFVLRMLKKVSKVKFDK